MNGYLEWTFQAFPTIAYHVNKNESLGMYSFLLIEWTFWLLKLVHDSYTTTPRWGVIDWAKPSRLSTHELSLTRGLLPSMDGGCFGYKTLPCCLSKSVRKALPCKWLPLRVAVHFIWTSSKKNTTTIQQLLFTFWFWLMFWNFRSSSPIDLNFRRSSSILISTPHPCSSLILTHTSTTYLIRPNPPFYYCNISACQMTLQAYCGKIANILTRSQAWGLQRTSFCHLRR